MSNVLKHSQNYRGRMLDESRMKCKTFNHIQDGPFWGCSLLPKINHTYPTNMNRSTVIPYLKKIT